MNAIIAFFHFASFFLLALAVFRRLSLSVMFGLSERRTFMV